MKNNKITRREFLKELGLSSMAFETAYLNFFPGNLFLQNSIKVECYDSSTRMIRENSKVLTGKGRGLIECYPLGSEIYLWLLSLLPENLRIEGIKWGISISQGNKLEQLRNFDVQNLFEWCINQYSKKESGKMYSSIVIGPPNGGSIHLSSLLRAPYLTSNFQLSFKHKIDPDNIESYLKFGKKLGNFFQTDGIEIINHYDPYHDRDLIEYLHRIRVRLTELPKIYKDFILNNLNEDGKLIFANCTFPWLQYEIEKNNFLQVGGLGNFKPEEYLKKWFLKLPLKERPESEWGCPKELEKSIKDFVKRNNIPFLEITFDSPEKYSFLAYKTYLSKKVKKDKIILDCFYYFNPYTNIRTGIPSFWLPFNTQYSLNLAKEFLDGKEFEKIYLTLVPSFAQSPDTTLIEDWKNAITEGELEILGMDPKTFPADTLAPFRFTEKMKRLRKEERILEPLKINLPAFEEILKDFT